MNWAKTIVGRGNARRAVAVVVCVALVYLTGGASFLHQHADGSDTACSICQALHMPTLASAVLELIPEAGPVVGHVSLPLDTAPADSFTLHRASRAPPIA
jgi:hypothetical protein